MILTGTLMREFSNHKPLTDELMAPAGAPVAVVYRNGVAIAPGAPPVIANPGVGMYNLTYGLTAANGHAAGDWVTITIGATTDGIAVVAPVWEGNLVTAPADVALLLGQTAYPMFTTHQPSTGANQAPDGGAAPVVTVYRNLVLTAIVPVLINPAVGVYIVTLPLTAAAGWAAGDQVGVFATATIDGIASGGWVFEGGILVAAMGGGGGASHHEVIGHSLRMTG